MANEHEIMEADVVIVGGGPAGLAAAYHLATLIEQHNARIDAGTSTGEKLDAGNIFVLEKAGALGAHSLSGAVMDPAGIQELIPDFEAQDFPVERRVTSEKVFLLAGKGKIGFPFAPPPMRNHGNLIVSLSSVVKWLGERVEARGINVLAGFPAARIVYEDGKVAGVCSGDMGVAADGTRKPNFEPGTEIRAKLTLFAEGPRGHLMKELTRKLDLEDIGAETAARFGYTRGRANPQVYATGVKEIWSLAGEKFDGLGWDVVHTMGYPLPHHTFGGSWLYRLTDNRISLGLVVGLDSPDPGLDPHGYFQLLKHHPFFRRLLEGARLVRYGAKTISEGGYFSIPRLALDHAMVLGESGGLVNVPRLKGIHYAIKSGMLAAEQAVKALLAGDFSAAALRPYDDAVRAYGGAGDWVGRELRRYRHSKANFRNGFVPGLVRSGLQELLRGWWPGGQRELREDHTHVRKLGEFRGTTAQKLWQKHGLKVDNEKLIYDRLTGVYESGTVHEEDQPCHLVIAPDDVANICNDRCTREYGNPCQYFCPANVYEMEDRDAGSGRKTLKLNPSNCVHCKTCDIRDPYAVITWVTPEGGGGPDYAGM
ncbi:MAG: electron transfer flavoprotein-ubiquinone oxidoreductase [Planctomycetes bacterium]|nr:electron transfer flavoprotein-ubiquinone oxidoreductase [Planctomycetota bacterium]